MTHHQDPASPVPDPLIAPHVVTAEQAEALTNSIDRLRREVHSRSVGFLVALVLIAALGIALAIVGYRAERSSTATDQFLSCQIAQNAEFRKAGATERAAQRKLFDTILNPASTPTDRLKATQDYYAGLIAADHQRTNIGNC